MSSAASNGTLSCLMSKRDNKFKFPLLQSTKVRMDYVLKKAKLMAQMKMSGGKKPSRKIQVNGGRNIGRLSCIFIVRR